MAVALAAIIGVSIIPSQTADAAAIPANYANFSKVASYANAKFSDVPTGTWYSAAVQAGYEYGLISGQGVGKFNPTGNLTIAEAIKLAASVNAVYYGRTIPKSTGGNWYDVYVNYAKQNSMLDAGILKKSMTAKATREEVASIISYAVPYDTSLQPKAKPSDLTGQFVAGGYSDSQGVYREAVQKATESLYYKAILKLYQAGITGGDSKGKFNHKSNITRAEMAIILNRMAVPTSRIGASSTPTATTPTVDRTGKDYGWGTDYFRGNEAIGYDPVLYIYGKKVVFSKEARPIYRYNINPLSDKTVEATSTTNFYPFREVLIGLGASIGVTNKDGTFDFSINGTEFSYCNTGLNTAIEMGVKVTKDNTGGLLGTRTIGKVYTLYNNVGYMNMSLVHNLALAKPGLFEMDVNYAIAYILGLDNMTDYKQDTTEGQLLFVSQLRKAHSEIPLKWFSTNDNNYASDIMTSEDRVKIANLAKEWSKNAKTDYDKARAVADGICAMMNYGTIYGYDTVLDRAMEGKLGICTTYMFTYTVALRELGIPVTTMESNSHGWNEFYDGSRWVVVDVTWMDGGNPDMYFDMGDKPVADKMSPFFSSIQLN